MDKAKPRVRQAHFAGPGSCIILPLQGLDDPYQSSNLMPFAPTKRLWLCRSLCEI